MTKQNYHRVFAEGFRAAERSMLAVCVFRAAGLSAVRQGRDRRRAPRRARSGAPRRAASIRRELGRLNSEFAHYVPADRQTPEVELCPADDPGFLPPRVKHRYTRP